MSNIGEDINTSSDNDLNTTTNNNSINRLVEEIDNLVTDISNININLELDENIIPSSAGSDSIQQSNIKPEVKSNKYKNIGSQQNYLKIPKNNTIYNFLKYFKKSSQFSKKDLRKISNAIYMAFKRKNGENVALDRVLQLENERIYTVYVYPEDMKDEMRRIVIWFYNIKKLRENRHKKHLQEAKLEKLKKTDITAYKAELERIKQESNNKKYNRNTQNKNQNSKHIRTKQNFSKLKRIDSEKINKSDNFEKKSQINKKVSKKQLDYEMYKKLQKQMQTVNRPD